MARKVANLTGNPFFTNREMKCKCAKCKHAYLHEELMKRITEARKNANIPFVITSGCRCPEHNKKVGGAVNSDHLADEKDFICCGVDIHCINDRNRFIIIKALLDVGIDRLGLSTNFIHAGISGRNSGEVAWFYRN